MPSSREVYDQVAKVAGQMVPSIRTYFLVSAVVYLAAAGATFVQGDAIHTELCAIDPVLQACNCSDTILSCVPPTTTAMPEAVAHAESIVTLQRTTRSPPSGTIFAGVVARRLDEELSEFDREMIAWQEQQTQMSTASPLDLFAGQNFSNMTDDSLSALRKMQSPNYLKHRPVEVHEETPKKKEEWTSATLQWVSEMGRGLQTVELPTGEVGPWTPCICDVVCGNGTRSRDVSCPTGTCTSATEETCVCNHCADCVADIFMLVLMITFSAQGVIAVLVFFAFNQFVGKTNAQLASMNICEKCLGCLCKKLPNLVRLIALSNMLLIVFILLQVFLIPPLLGTFSDCPNSPAYQLTAILLAIIWLSQFALGTIAKKFSPIPPFLYTPSAPSKGFSLDKLLRAMGP
mmetsp:Transcript_24336/g.55555  ORF Transcript_24336/g.55555 Transcript_24336/m.55555 type:complete len:403 (+) Transcript_24336:105-1313(+)